MCGVAGVFGVGKPLKALCDMMQALQYRGEQGAGVRLLRSDGSAFYERELGPLTELSRKIRFQPPADDNFVAGIGHLRYGTSGTRRLVANTGPLYGEMSWGSLSFAHNGDTPNYDLLKKDLFGKGYFFTSDTDSEFILQYIASIRASSSIDAIRRGLSQYKGTFALAMLVRDSDGVKLIAARDHSGNRPLALGRLDKGYIVASEDNAFEAVSGEFIREINAGELLVISKDGLQELQLIFHYPQRIGLQQCVFENIYFELPTSKKMFGLSIKAFREGLGRKAAKSCGFLVEAGDVVANVPDSSNPFADGFCKELGRPVERALVRRHSPKVRAFTQEDFEQREDAVRKKFSIDSEVVSGKRVWVLDDSIVRGITLRKIARLLRSLGATWIGFIVSCEPIIGPCGKGMDFSAEGLVARKYLTGPKQIDVDVDAVREYVEADALYYNTRENVVSVIRELGGNPENFCFGCFDNKEPIWGAW